MWRNACGDEQHLGKPKRQFDLGCEPQMAVVNRVEGSTDDAQCANHRRGVAWAAGLELMSRRTHDQRFLEIDVSLQHPHHFVEDSAMPPATRSSGSGKGIHLPSAATPATASSNPSVISMIPTSGW